MNVDDEVLADVAALKLINIFVCYSAKRAKNKIDGLSLTNHFSMTLKDISKHNVSFTKHASLNYYKINNFQCKTKPRELTLRMKSESNWKCRSLPVICYQRKTKQTLRSTQNEARVTTS